MNYKKSCIPFWNQLLIFALRDGVGRIVNFLGIQSAVKSQKVIAKLKSSDVSSTTSTSSVSEDSSSRILRQVRVSFDRRRCVWQNGTHMFCVVRHIYYLCVCVRRVNVCFVLFMYVLLYFIGVKWLRFVLE